jgi:hypothetical protein
MAQVESQGICGEPGAAGQPIRRFALMAGVTAIAIAVFGLLYYFVLYLASE